LKESFLSAGNRQFNLRLTKLNPRAKMLRYAGKKSWAARALGRGAKTLFRQTNKNPTWTRRVAVSTKVLKALVRR
jgi:hypothetical protein